MPQLTPREHGQVCSQVVCVCGILLTIYMGLTFPPLLLADMAEPIQQITTNNNGTHERETVPFTLISRKEKVGREGGIKRFRRKQAGDFPAQIK